jgi:hypothetical protein
MRVSDRGKERTTENDGFPGVRGSRPDTGASRLAGDNGKKDEHDKNAPRPTMPRQNVSSYLHRDANFGRDRDRAIERSTFLKSPDKVVRLFLSWPGQRDPKIDVIETVRLRSRTDTRDLGFYMAERDAPIPGEALYEMNGARGNARQEGVGWNDLFLWLGRAVDDEMMRPGRIERAPEYVSRR